MSARLGAKVRAHRRKLGLTQVEVAKRLGISASYLNLIEHEQRPLTAELLIKVAGELQLDLAELASDNDARLASDLVEIFSDPIFDEHQLNAADVRELAQTSPSLSRAILSLYAAFRASRDSAEELAVRIYDDQEGALDGFDVERARMPSEEVNDFVQRRMNYFPEMEEAANSLWRDAGLEMGARYRGMVRFLERRGIEVVVGGVGTHRGALRRFDADRRRVSLSEALPPHSRNFQLAVQIGLITQEDAIESILAQTGFTSEASRSLTRLVLANYFAGAVLMPYRAFLVAAKGERYDVELLGHRFGTSFEQVCHRLTTLREPGHEGIPFHMIRVDLAGNISKRFSASGIRFARFSGACSRWNVFTAFQTPGRIRTQVSIMPGGEKYFCIARTVPKGRGGYHAPQSTLALGLGCRLDHARELVYADGVDLEMEGVAIGVTCRLCDRKDCEQRAFPSLRHPLRIDENVRGLSFFTPVD